MPEHVVSPDLFELLDDYANLLDAGEAIVDDVVPATSPVIVFTESAFTQFFENEVEIAIEGFDETAMQRAARARAAKKDELSPQAKRLITVFKQFCERYDDVKSAAYGGHEQVLEEFHATLLVRLVQRIGALAKVKGDKALMDRANDSLEHFRDIVATYPWTDHDRSVDDIE
jgi:hypothetical protein